MLEAVLCKNDVLTHSLDRTTKHTQWLREYLEYTSWVVDDSEATFVWSTFVGVISFITPMHALALKSSISCLTQALFVQSVELTEKAIRFLTGIITTTDLDGVKMNQLAEC